MRNTLFHAAVIAVGVTVGLAVAMTSAGAEHGDSSVDSKNGIADDGGVTDRELAALLDEIERTGLLPVGVDATGDGPYGYVDADKAVIVDGEPPAELRVVDADGRHIGWLVHGLTPMSAEDYLRDPAGHRLAGATRVKDLTAAIGSAGPAD